MVLFGSNDGFLNAASSRVLIPAPERASLRHAQTPAGFCRLVAKPKGARSIQELCAFGQRRFPDARVVIDAAFQPR